jgi:hypothetical protein
MRYFCSPDDDDFEPIDDGDYDDNTEEDDIDDEDEEDSVDDTDASGDDEDLSLDDGSDEIDSGTDGLEEDDPDVFLSADDFPDADAEDFEPDQGDWTLDDYNESAENLFGQHEFFGDTLTTQLEDAGFTPFQNPQFAQGFDQIAPGTSETVQLFERDGQLHAFGLVSSAVLAALQARYTGLDLSNLQLAVPKLGEFAPPQPLPPEYASVPEKEAVDLRKFATPVGDQLQTSRCSAFAWTHAVELSRNVLYGKTPRLSPSYAMLQFQRAQGDARDYEYAYDGGEGTVGGPEPGKVLTSNGTCRQELWPDNEPEPRADERVLATDARQYPLEGTPLPIALEDVRKVLSAGCPVHVGMNTGRTFTEVGRDGLFQAAEAPDGRHGRHAMLIVGYVGNFFTLKNSWGQGWGDGGYCYVPRIVMTASEPEFTAVLLKQKPTQ